MVLRCAWGTCNADERYPERLQGGRFISFPKPKTDLHKCLRWIKACGRPHEQLNVNRINKHKAVCSKHFVGVNGPTKEYPDPIQADGSNITPARPAPKRRIVSDKSSKPSKRKKLEYQPEDNHDSELCNVTDPPNSVATETEEPWVSGMDMFVMAAEIHSLKSEVASQHETINFLEQKLKEKEDIIRQMQKNVENKANFGVDSILEREAKLKGLFKYYTGITYIRFTALFAFLSPGGSCIQYEKGRKDLKDLSVEDGLLLTLCRLRHNFGLKDLSMRFKLTLQSSGIVFNTWICHMYMKLGQLCIWPHRDVIINNMPKDFKHDYPTTLVIIDGTELKTQVPCALGLQSQLYSDYKSSTTLKALIGCDPRGSVIFASELFTGSISDKSITEQSGFYDVIKTLKSEGYIKEGDAVMADKGFTIKDELNELGIKLNIPPFASAGGQMSVSDTMTTEKIAKHRVHIERLISKVKTYKILSERIPTSLFQNINKIWSVCCYLTLYQDVFVKD